MKKYGIITHYDVHNHGALLQLTALVKVLKSMGIEAHALRFDKNYDFMGHELKAKYDVSVKSVGIYLKYLVEKGLGCTRYNFSKRNTLNRYRLAQNLIGDYYSESPKLDGVIIGSDEVFALHTGPTPVFFGYCLPADYVVTYAGSFGPTTIKDINRWHAKNFVRSGLESMNYVTVRDANSAKIVKMLTGKHPQIVVDPVLLYGYNDEIKTMERPLNEDYLLVYAYDNRLNDTVEVETIRSYAHSKSLKIVSAGFYHSWCDKCVDVDPINLLGWFKHAKEVITDTFHGSVMSIITGAKVAVKTRESNHLKLSNLLNEYNMSNRIFSSWDKLEETMKSEIDYAKVNIEVKKRRAASMVELNKMIENK